LYVPKKTIFVLCYQLFNCHTKYINNIGTILFTYNNKERDCKKYTFQKKFSVSLLLYSLALSEEADPRFKGSSIGATPNFTNNASNSLILILPSLSTSYSLNNDPNALSSTL